MRLVSFYGSIDRTHLKLVLDLGIDAQRVIVYIYLVVCFLSGVRYRVPRSSIVTVMDADEEVIVAAIIVLLQAQLDAIIEESIAEEAIDEEAIDKEATVENTQRPS